MCDRNTTQINSSQMFFINFFVLEELDLIIKISSEAKILKKILEENKKKLEVYKILSSEI